MLHSGLAIAGLCAAATVSWHTDADSATRKLAIIQAGKLARGAVVQFSTAELNAYAQSKIPVYAPGGVRSARIQLGSGTAIASGMVDFLKLRHATGVETNWLISQLIQGERPVRVATHIQSADGKATVFVDSVEISGLAVAGAPLDMLIQTFFRPLFPNAKINEPFPLKYGLNRIVITTAGLLVIARK